MASKGNSHAPYFFIFDFYIMQGSSDSNDVLPLAVVYFYPNDEQKKKDVNISFEYDQQKSLWINLETLRLRRDRWNDSILST